MRNAIRNARFISRFRLFLGKSDINVAVREPNRPPLRNLAHLRYLLILIEESSSIDLARFHAEGERVLRGGEHAGCVRCERARRAIGIIEIQN